MTIYRDSVIVIYLMDHVGPNQTRAQDRLTAMEQAGDTIAVSHVVRLECRVMPIRNSDAKSLAQFDDFFVRPYVQLVPVSPAVFDRATEIRAKHNLRLGDSLHLAAAIESGCDRFLTNDLRLNRCTDITIEVLP